MTTVFTPTLRLRADATTSSSYSTGSDGCVLCPTSQMSCPSCASNEVCNQRARTCSTCAENVCVASESSGGLSTNVGAIAGGVVGGVAVLALISLFLFYKYVYLKKHPRVDDMAMLDLEGENDDTGTNFDGLLTRNTVSSAEKTRPSAQRLDLSSSDTKNRRLLAYDSFMRPQARYSGRGGRKSPASTRSAPRNLGPYNDSDMSKRNSVATTISTTNALNILPIAYIPGVTVRPTKNNTQSIYSYETELIFSDINAIESASIVAERAQPKLTMTAIRAQPKLVNVQRIDEDEEEEEEDWANDTNGKTDLVEIGTRAVDSLGATYDPVSDDSDVDSDIGEINRANSVMRPEAHHDVDSEFKPPYHETERQDEESSAGSFILDIQRDN